MSTFIVCMMIYIHKLSDEIAAHAWVLRFPELTGGGTQMKRSLDIAAIAMTSLLLLAFAVLSLRGLIDPQTASARFGTPVSDIAGSLFYRVYLSRNLVIVASGAIFLLWRQWTPLAVLLTVTAALPVFDMSALWLSGITPPVFHPIALALIAITAALLWRRAAANPTSA